MNKKLSDQRMDQLISAWAGHDPLLELLFYVFGGGGGGGQGIRLLLVQTIGFLLNTWDSSIVAFELDVSLFGGMWVECHEN
mgnify:CR=1 FL=1